MEIAIILTLFILNGLFAMCEIALISSRKSRLEQAASKGSKGAITALNLLKEPEKFLSTVQIGITLVGIIAGAYGGEAFTEDIKPFFEKLNFTKPYAEEVAFVTVVAIITYFSLIIGELVPKTIAMNNPEGITITFARFMRILAIVTYPIVAFLSLSTKLFLKLFMIKERVNPPVTEEELKYMIQTGSQHGIIEKQEGEIMNSVFRFGDHTAATIMTHRTDIVWLDVNHSIEKSLAKIQNSTYSKFPVCQQHLDKVIGYITIKNILNAVQHGGDANIQNMMEDPVFFTANTPALKILDSFRKSRIHVGFVVNEFGGIEGLITLHDLIENIVGEFPEMEGDETSIVKRQDNSWLADGEIRVEELYNVLGHGFFPLQMPYSTLAGFIIYKMEKVPAVADKVIHKNFEFEVMDMDGARIDKVLIKKVL
jgi:putative hemolysin